MYFKRQFYGGGAEHDVRRKLWAEFECELCGAEDHVDITQMEATFNRSKPRRCPECGKYGKDDQLRNLRSEIDRLTETIEVSQARRAELIAEYERSSLEKAAS